MKHANTKTRTVDDVLTRIQAVAFTVGNGLLATLTVQLYLEYRKYS